MKATAYLLTIVGGLSTVFGLFPVIFLYPYKFSSTADYLSFVLFQAEDRWFWQIGLIVLIAGIALFRKQRKKKKHETTVELN